MAEVISGFLNSDTALNVLGLPGFICLLAFVFYHSLVARKVIGPLTQRGGLIILIAIIGYFTIATVAIIWNFRPQPSAPEVVSSDDISDFVRKLTITTPRTALESYFGKPTTEELFERFDERQPQDQQIIPTNIIVRTYQWNDRVFLATYSRANAVIAYALTANDIRLNAPHLGLGIDDGGYPEGTLKINDIDLRLLAHYGCEGSPEIDARVLWLMVGPCYLGSPGGYMKYAFGLATDDLSMNDVSLGCLEKHVEWWNTNKSKEFERIDAGACNLLGRIKAEAAVVMADIDPVGPERGETTANDILRDFTTRYGFGRGFSVAR